MSPALPLMVCVAFIFVLLGIERKQNPGAAIALWIPTLWMLIYGSRPVGSWFQNPLADSLTGDITAGYLAGDPYERVVFSALILLALYVLFRRKIEWALILKDNPILAFLIIFSGFSILWSAFPFLSMKRWIRLAGVVPAAVIILTELKPLQALESVFRRCTYVLIPLSFVLVKYYPQIGRMYGRWSGGVTWRGVTLTKNAFGQLCLFSAFFLVWESLREWRHARFVRFKSIKIADGLVLAISIFLLFRLGVTGGSATSIVALICCIVSMLFLFGMKNRAKSVATLLIYTVTFIWVLLIVGGSFVQDATQAVGRDASFTGRTDLWRMLLKIGARHPFFGAGYGGYFGTPGNEYQEVYGYVVGHNGLLDVFVELGVAGLMLVVAFHLRFYRKFRRGLDRFFDWGVFGLCFLIMSLLLNFSESLFLKSSSYIWSISVLLSIVFSLPFLTGGRNEGST